jgi:hypothetical protein
MVSINGALYIAAPWKILLNLAIYRGADGRLLRIDHHCWRCRGKGKYGASVLLHVHVVTPFLPRSAGRKGFDYSA